MPDEAAPPPSATSRAELVRTVQTPLGFFVLVVLVAEGILGGLAALSTGAERMLAIGGFIGTLAVLVAVVVGMAVWWPDALYARRPVGPGPGVLRLRRRWRSVRVVDGEEVHAEWSVTQDGDEVTAAVKATSGPYPGRRYKYRGVIRDRVITLMYTAADPHLPDRGTLTLKLSAAGDALDGYLSYFSTAHDRVEGCPYRCRAVR